MGAGDVGQLPGQHVLRVVILPREACGEDAEPHMNLGVEPKPLFSAIRALSPAGKPGSPPLRLTDVGEQALCSAGNSG